MLCIYSFSHLYIIKCLASSFSNKLKINDSVKVYTCQCHYAHPFLTNKLLHVFIMFIINMDKRIKGEKVYLVVQKHASLLCFTDIMSSDKIHISKSKLRRIDNPFINNQRVGYERYRPSFIT